MGRKFTSSYPSDRSEMFWSFHFDSVFLRQMKLCRQIVKRLKVLYSCVTKKFNIQFSLVSLHSAALLNAGTRLPPHKSSRFSSLRQSQRGNKNIRIETNKEVFPKIEKFHILDTLYVHKIYLCQPEISISQPLQVNDTLC